MRNRNAAVWPVAGALWLGGCGYVGEPLPPALNIPQAVPDLRTVQRGGRVVAEFTIPDRTTEQLPIKALGAVELHVGDVIVALAATGPGPARAEVPVTAYVGQELAIRVRVAAPNGRWSDFSNTMTLPIVAPLAAPSKPSVMVLADGVRLRWRLEPERPEAAFRIWRQTEGEQQPVMVARVTTREWLDTAGVYGKRYLYRVQATASAGSVEAEGELSPPESVVPEDRFAPATPVRLQVIAGIGSVELIWEPNAEIDLAGYRVYRASGAGGFERVSERVEAPSFSDRTITAGLSYRYQVSAVDQRGNESERTAPVGARVPAQ